MSKSNPTNHVEIITSVQSAGAGLPLRKFGWLIRPIHAESGYLQGFLRGLFPYLSFYLPKIRSANSARAPSGLRTACSRNGARMPLGRRQAAAHEFFWRGMT